MYDCIGKFTIGSHVSTGRTHGWIPLQTPSEENLS